MFINVETCLPMCKWDFQCFKLLCNKDVWTQLSEQCYTMHITYYKAYLIVYERQELIRANKFKLVHDLFTHV